MKNIYFLGDSLTEGSLSYNWVYNFNMPCNLFNVINKGINGLTVCTLYYKLVNNMIFNNPDYVVLMIGGNDIIGCTNEEYGNFYMNLYPSIQVEAPSLKNYERDLTNIIDKLDKELPITSHLIVLSTPPIGEGGPESIQWKLGDNFNEICKKIVNNSSNRVIYKDLFNEVIIDMDKYIDKNYTPFKLSISLMYIAWFLSYFFTWETVRWIIGFKYTTDGVHYCKEFGMICDKLVLEAIVSIEENTKQI